MAATRAERLHCKTKDLNKLIEEGDRVIKRFGVNGSIISSVIMSAFVRVFSLVQILIVSYLFGIQRSMDILTYSVSLVTLITSFTISLNQSVFIPIGIKIKNKDGEGGSIQFFNYIYLIYFVLGLFICILLYTSPVKAFSIISKFSESDIADNIGIIKLLIPNIFLLIINSYLLDLCTAHKFFVIPLIFELIKSICVITIILIFNKAFNTESMAIGILVSNFVQFIMLHFFVIRKLSWKFIFKHVKLDQLAKRNIGYVTLGQIATFLNAFVSMFLISGFNEGIYTALDYSQKLNGMILTVIIAQVSTVIGIEFIDHYTKEDFMSVNNLFVNYTKSTLILLIPLCFILSINGEAIISILFERGEFSHDAVIVTKNLFQIIIFAIPPILLNNLVTKLIIAKQVQSIAFIYQIISNISSAILIFVFIKGFGYTGYSIGYVFFYYLYTFIALNVLVKKEFKFINYNAILKFICINFILNLPLVYVTQIILSKFKYNNFFTNVIICAVSTILYMLLYILLSLLYKPNREIIVRVITTVYNKMNYKIKG